MNRVLVSIIALSVAATALGQVTPSAEGGQNLMAHQQAFLNLPKAQRDDYAKLLKDAERMFAEKRMFEALDKVSNARKIFKDDPQALNIYGSCQVEFRAFDKATKALSRARELAPENPAVRFNFAEIYFVTGKWKEAEKEFKELLDSDGGKIMGKEYVQLAEFKIMLCKLKTGQKEEAEIYAKKYNFLDDTPYYYFANAALAYSEKDEIRAIEWLQRAERVFRNPATLAGWEDTLVEFGYIKSVFGAVQPSAQ